MSVSCVFWGDGHWARGSPQTCKAPVLTPRYTAAHTALVAGGICLTLLCTQLSFIASVLGKAKVGVPWPVPVCGLMLPCCSLMGCPPLLLLQRKWYKTENEYYLLQFTLTVRCLYYTSFSLELCRQPPSAQRTSYSFPWLLAFVFYYPVFHNGPIINFPEFFKQVESSGGRGWCLVGLYIVDCELGPPKWGCILSVGFTKSLGTVKGF